MKASLFSLLVVVAVACGACSDTTSPADPNVFTGTNGFVINGGDYSHVQVPAEKASVEFLDEHGAQRGIRLGVAHLDSTDIDVNIAIPDNVTGPGTFNWVPEDEFSPEKAYFDIEHGEELFTSSTGQTTITTFGPIGGKVTGTFSGKVFDPEKKVTFDVQGKFSALRVD